MQKKHDHLYLYDDLTEVSDKCNHPEDLCITSSTDSWGMFTIHCIKCDTTFSRYAWRDIEDQRGRYKDVRLDDK